VAKPRPTNDYVAKPRTPSLPNKLIHLLRSLISIPSICVFFV
jgi:hypothetical protein